MRMQRKIRYAVGDMGVSLVYFAVGSYFLFYLSDILGMAPLLAGIVFFIGKLWDSVNDPLIGILSDKTKSRFGRKRVYILFGAVPFALSFTLLWMIPVGIGEGLQFILATIGLLLFATTYSLVTVPYMAMVPVMTDDYDERTQITGLRAILSTLGTVLGGAVALLVARAADQVTGLRGMAIGFGLFTLVALLIAAQSIEGIEEKKEAHSPIMQLPLARYPAILRDKNLLILLAFKFLGAIATSCLVAAIPYFSTYVLKDQGIGTYGLTLYVLSSAIFIPLWNRLTHHYDKRHLLLLSISAVAVVLLITSILISSQTVLLFYGACIVLGAFMASYLMIPYSLVPDLVDSYESKTGERHESVFFGLWMAAHQFGVAAAGLVLGTLLTAGGYDGGAEVQSDTALLAVRLGFGLVPAIFLLLATVLLQKYGITRSVYQEIKTRLQLKTHSAD